jgi:hypothetical protein
MFRCTNPILLCEKKLIHLGAEDSTRLQDAHGMAKRRRPSDSIPSTTEIRKLLDFVGPRGYMKRYWFVLVTTALPDSGSPL